MIVRISETADEVRIAFEAQNLQEERDLAEVSKAVLHSQSPTEGLVLEIQAALIVKGHNIRLIDERVAAAG